MVENLAIGERAVLLAPDRSDTWDWLAEARFHAGSILGVDLRSAHERAAAEFAKALEFDSGYAPALSHLVEYAVETRDSVSAQRDLADYVRWLAAVVSEDTAGLRTLRLRVPQMETGSLLRIVGDGQLEAIGLQDVERAAAVLRGRSGAPEDLWQVYSALHNLALN